MSENTIRDDDPEPGLFEAFRPPARESVLDAIERLHGAGASVLLRDTGEETTPVLLRRSGEGSARDDSRYQILGEIARGGIGVVYKGRDRDLNRDIALKVLRPEYAERDDVIQRFIEEAQVGGQLQHPGIVPIYGIGLQADGRPCFAMKLIKGRTLAELLDSNPRGIDLLAVFEQIAQTMAYAHSRGVIHRDLKPANVMIGAFGEVQVVDWGFAKVLGREEPRPQPGHTVIATVRSGPEGSQSIAGSVMGTPAYMPPEQAMGQIEELDERSDVFALGAILCEILTGQPPYTGGVRDQIIAATQCRLEKAFERLDAAAAADGLKRLVRDCLAPLGADRPGSAGVVAERLAQHLASVEERARNAELDAIAAQARAARERQARRRALALAGVALLAVATGGGGYYLWKSELDARMARAAPRIAEAMREATGREGDRDWTAAIAAARRAVDVAASEGVDATEPRALLVRLEREEERAAEAARIEAEDDAFLEELEGIAARWHKGWAAGGVPGVEPTASASAPGDTADAGTDAAYRAAFERRFPSLEGAGEALKRSRHASEYAANLGFWSWIGTTRLGTAAPDGRAVDRLAREVEPGRDDLRDALLADDPDALLALANAQGDQMPPALAAQVGLALASRERAAEAVAFLRRMHVRAAGDIRIHMALVFAAGRLGDHGLAEQHRLCAFTLRPDR